MERKEQPRDWEPERILKAITEKGVPVAELAKLWGVPKSSIYSAIKKPGYGDCERYIVDYIGTSFGVVFAGRLAERQEKAERRAKALLEAKALVEQRVA